MGLARRRSAATTRRYVLRQFRFVTFGACVSPATAFLKAYRSQPITSKVCQGPKTDGCLSESQAATLIKAFAGAKDSKGRAYAGFPFDTGIAATQGLPGLLLGGASPTGISFADIGMNVDNAADAARSDPFAAISETSSLTNLNTFSGHGGKLVFFHGLSDPWFSPNDTVDCYERMTKANGGSEQVRGWSRPFRGSEASSLRFWPRPIQRVCPLLDQFSFHCSPEKTPTQNELRNTCQTFRIKVRL